MRHSTLLIAVLLLTLGACASRPGQDPFRRGEPLGVAFSRGGGLDGGTQSLIITSDGDYTLERDGRRARVGSLGAAQLAALRQRIDAVRWHALRERYDDDRGRDAYTYALSVTSASGATRGVTLTDASSAQPPREVRDLLGHLNTLLDDLSPRKP